MNDIAVFQYGDNGHQVRTVVLDGEPWFVANDVCDILALGNPRTSLSLLDDDDKGVHSMDTPGGRQQMTVVNEPGLYSLVLSSRKPEARAFKRWVTHEVIPAIRKTGAYSVQAMSPEDAVIASLQMLKEQRLRTERLEQQTTQQAKQLEVINHRIDSLDAANIDGDIQQRLNAMVKRYSHQKGVTFNKGWHDFIQAYNMAYRTNLELLKGNYCQRHGLRNLTTPQYLSLTGALEDGVRVADKMLNSGSSVQGCA